MNEKCGDMNEKCYELVSVLMGNFLRMSLLLEAHGGEIDSDLYPAGAELQEAARELTEFVKVNGLEHAAKAMMSEYGIAV